MGGAPACSCMCRLRGRGLEVGLAPSFQRSGKSNIALTAIVERISNVIGYPGSVFGLCPCMGASCERERCSEG